jgi:CheY-like chemotaxis protein
VAGTGLGLSIAKKLTELMHGQITVESELDKGSVFEVTVRQGYAGDEEIGQKTADNLNSFSYTDMKKQRTKLNRINLSYARVLLVDDFPSNLDVSAGLLRKYKMQVDCVDNGREAVGLIKAEKVKYDAVFMDHMMPEMDGVEATALIRAIDSQYAKTVPIIALTANALIGNEKMFLENGFDAFLPKPIAVTKLDAIVRKYIKDESRENG